MGDILSTPGGRLGRIGDDLQSAYSAVPSSSTSRASDPSGLAASVRNTACPASVRQIDVVSVSPGNTGEANRAPTWLILGAARPPPSSLPSARPAAPYVQSPCRIGFGKPARFCANQGSLWSGFRSPDSR